MKVAPVTIPQLFAVGAVCVLGYLAYKSYKAISSVSVGALADVVVAGAANAVDVRTVDQNPNDFSLGGVQQAVSNAVQRGQDAGATNFFSAYLTGIFK